MTDPRHGEHPDLERLAEYAAGRLHGDEAERIAGHLEDCPFCRLERKRLDRFATIEDDEELLAEAEWPRAELLLQRAYAEKVRPAASAGRVARTAAARAQGRRLRWLAPLAAAAAVLLFFVATVDRGTRLPLLPGGPDTMRGVEAGAAGPAIVLTAPVGEVAEAPRLFSWRADSLYESFSLTVFTPDLETVFRRDALDASPFAVPDSLRALLTPARTYVWSVEGHAGLARASLSPSNWFRIAGE